MEGPVLPGAVDALWLLVVAVAGQLGQVFVTRGLARVPAGRATLANLGCWVAPGTITIPKAHEALSEGGEPLEARGAGELERQLEAFLDAAERLRP